MWSLGPGCCLCLGTLPSLSFISLVPLCQLTQSQPSGQKSLPVREMFLEPKRRGFLSETPTEGIHIGFPQNTDSLRIVQVGSSCQTWAPQKQGPQLHCSCRWCQHTGRHVKSRCLHAQRSFHLCLALLLSMSKTIKREVDGNDSP